MVQHLTDVASYDVTKINNSPGLYYNNIGEAKIANQAINLLHYFNLTNVRSMLLLSERQYANSEKLCDLVTQLHVH